MIGPVRMEIRHRIRIVGNDGHSSLSSGRRYVCGDVRTSAHGQLCVHSQSGQTGLLAQTEIRLLKGIHKMEESAGRHLKESVMYIGGGRGHIASNTMQFRQEITESKLIRIT